MPSLRSLARAWLPRSLKSSVQQLALGYHSYAPSFSVAGEDMILRHLIGSEKMDGFFVDVGAYHPVLLSNTYFFYLNGWRGINIEPRPGSRALFEATRPGDINLEIGISNERGEMTYYFIGEDSPMNSFSPQFLEEIQMLGEVKRKIPIAVLTLAEVLEQNLPAKQAIDFMSVDVEGHDLKVLESNDWEAFRPKYLVVEDEGVDVQKSEIVKFMNAQGYDVWAQNVMIPGKIYEYFFVDRSL